jgi:Calcineurin-like phosphoesterase
MNNHRGHAHDHSLPAKTRELRQSSTTALIALVAIALPAVALAACTDETEPSTHPPKSASAGVDEAGGNVNRLAFAVVGDTRPAVVDDTPGYPNAIVSTIYQDIQALDPRPAFAVATGDYIYSHAHSRTAVDQLSLYLSARRRFSGVLFPAMGNHECNGLTESNCGPDGTSGASNNYDAFMTMLLGPIEKTSPYYVVEVDGLDQTWTAKLVFIAANAWSQDQADWLSAVLSTPTTYTFIVRHEPKSAETAPGVIPSELIMRRHPYTLAIVGHMHTYAHSGPREVVIGNGGAPPTGHKNFGFGLVQRQDDGTIQVDVMDYLTAQPDLAFRFALNADGTPAL